jgi:predicted small lipoprotein YifL
MGAMTRYAYLLPAAIALLLMLALAGCGNGKY